MPHRPRVGVFSRGNGYLVRLWLVQAVDILEMPDHKDQVLTGWKSPRFYGGQLDKQLVNRDASRSCHQFHERHLITICLQNKDLSMIVKLLHISN
jgi:hypothetical protein